MNKDHWTIAVAVLKQQSKIISNTQHLHEVTALRPTLRR